MRVDWRPETEDWRPVICSSIVALVVAAAAPLAQQAPQKREADTSPHFEVASVKANKSGDRAGNVRWEGTRFTAVNMPLRVLIIYAYQLQPFQLVGAPGWTADARFDITAKIEGDPEPARPTSEPDQMRLATRALLTDRFKLVTHRETRPMDIYALVVARPDGTLGPALKVSAQDCFSPAASRRGAPPPTEPGGLPPVVCGIQAAPGKIRFGGLPLSQFANSLAGAAGRIVVDRTGLTGAWDFELAFASDPPRTPLPPTEPPLSDPDAPSLFTAVQEQLGLKLEPATGDVEVIVVDGIQRPTTD